MFEEEDILYGKLRPYLVVHFPNLVYNYDIPFHLKEEQRMPKTLPSWPVRAEEEQPPRRLAHARSAPAAIVQRARGIVYMLGIWGRLPKKRARQSDFDGRGASTGSNGSIARALRVCWTGGGRVTPDRGTRRYAARACA